MSETETETLTPDIDLLVEAADSCRAHGAPWADALADLMEALAHDAESVGADYNAVNFASAWLTAQDAPAEVPA